MDEKEIERLAREIVCWANTRHLSNYTLIAQLIDLYSPKIVSMLMPVVRLAEAQARLDERRLCKQDIQEAVGNWGGPEREHYTQAMKRCIFVIEQRANGLDQWGQPVEQAKGETK